MKRILSTIILLSVTAALLGLASCEKTPGRIEDSMFVIRASVGEATQAGVPLTVLLSHGVLEGECRADIDVVNAADDSRPDMEVLLGGEAAITPSSTWTFDADGKAEFVIAGLGKGSYFGTVSVTRWYHTSTDRFYFNIK